MKNNKNGDIETFVPPKAKKLDLEHVQSNVQYLQGRILTLIEASTQDPEQRKAQKDIVRMYFGDTISWIVQSAFPELPVKTRGELEAQGIDLEEIERNAVDA